MAFTIPSLTSETRVSVSVSAYTIVGQGVLANLTVHMTSTICEFILSTLKFIGRLVSNTVTMHMHMYFEYL